VETPAGFKGPKPTGIEIQAVTTTKLPLKPALLANMKSTNYLLNALLQMEADERSAQMAIQVDSRGVVAESSVSCVVCIGKDGVLRAPLPDQILPSITLQRLLELSTKLVDRGLIAGVERCDFRIEDMLDSVELVDVSGGWCRAVTKLDGAVIGRGVAGGVFHEIRSLLIEDFENSEHLDPIP